MLPTFFIVGAAKSGTTSLANYLDEHPDVFISKVKEPNFFSSKQLLEDHLYYKDKLITSFSQYKKLFEGSESFAQRGEASVSYLVYPGVAENIKKMCPDARIVIILRNPVDRAYSHYLMDKKHRLVDIEFEDVVHKNSNDPYLDKYYHQYIKVGLYSVQVKAYIDVFGIDNVKIFLFDELNNTQKVTKSLFKFLELSSDFEPDIQKVHNAYEEPRNFVSHYLYSIAGLRKFIKKMFPDFLIVIIKNLIFSKAEKPVLGADIREYLRNYYHDDSCKLSKLIDRDLSFWHSN